MAALTIPALLLLLIRLGGPLPTPCARPMRSLVATARADRSWREQQLAQVRGHYEIARAVADARLCESLRRGAR